MLNISKSIKIAFLFLCCFTSLASNAQEITNYQAYYGSYTEAGKDFIVLRKFSENAKPVYMVVNPESMTTSIIAASSVIVVSQSFEDLRIRFADKAYFRAVTDADKNSKSMQDAGITHSISPEKGISLTIDLCPSSKALDRRIFSDLINEFKKIQMPVPIAVSVSGKWITKHKDDLSWLKSLIAAGDISVEWVNHTYSHPTNKKLPLDENFLLEKGVNISDEILKNEILMFQNGLMPSVFFRFPGLVSDQSVFLKVTGFGVIPVGSDAWLAKGEKPVDGSFVLIHGNGNEPVGVLKFIELLKTENGQIKAKDWRLYDIRDSLIVTKDVQP